MSTGLVPLSKMHETRTVSDFAIIAQALDSHIIVQASRFGLQSMSDFRILEYEHSSVAIPSTNLSFR